jgi:chromate transporter
MMPEPEPREVAANDPGAVGRRATLRDLAFYFLRLGTVGFGGPIALAGHMQRDLVEERRWVSKQDYLEGLAFSQLSPGPLAAQRCISAGYRQVRSVQP